MTDQTTQPDPKTRSNPPARPLWVKVLVGVVAGLLLLMVALHLTGHAPIGHGMGHHQAIAPSGEPGRP
jgi:hypothetical protein